ncbi:hypothetical protein HYQ46_008349 [Verticillium longisporum]|nr:hypothetical protein HYQ44_010250 [Verticillium longisporum]KAG7138240.1 hypothetical protein HYQ46_008349 [Verticillium longisporum]
MSQGREAAGRAEEQQLISMAKAAARTSTLQHYVMSSLPPASIVSRGKLPVPHFDFKHAAFQWTEESLPDLAAKTTRVWVSFYPSNPAYGGAMKIVPLPGSDVYAWIQPSRQDAILPIAGDVSHNVGVVVEGILEAGPKSFGKVAVVITDYLNMTDVVKVWQSVSGQKGVYLGVSDEAYERIWALLARNLPLSVAGANSSQTCTSCSLKIR